MPSLFRARTRVVVRKGLKDAIGRSPEFAAAIAPIVDEFVDRAKQLAPVGDDVPHYRDQITGSVERAGVTGRGRYIGRVRASKFTSIWIEYGTTDTPIFAPLRKAAASLGLRTKPMRKRGQTS